MSFMHMDATTAIGAPIEEFTLTSAFISAYDPWYAQAGIRVNCAGTLFKRQNYSLNQIAPATDWVFPRDNFPADAGLYQARMTNFGYNNPKSGSETFGDTWTVLTAGGGTSTGIYLEWAHDMNRADAGSGAMTLDIRFGDGTDPINTVTSAYIGDSAPCVATRVYTFNIEAN